MTLITDEAVEAATGGVYPDAHARDILAAFIAFHEGERLCYGDDDCAMYSCVRCGGTGKVRDDNVVMEKPTRADERAKVLSEVVAIVERLTAQSRTGLLNPEALLREFGGNR